MNAFTLKMIGISLMVLDHLYTYITGMQIWFGYVGRVVAPIFFFLIVQGFIHTRSQMKYMLRLFGFGLLMFLINLLFDFTNNIFLSLGLGVALLQSLDYGKQTKNYALSFF